ncbi:MAG: hypothetical protein AAF412_03630 [Pseudomonadota bacterium]
MKQETVRPFSNGDEFMRWEARNCARCTKQWQHGLPENSSCKIEQQLALACLDDGTIPLNIYQRMGSGSATCPEFIKAPPPPEPSNDYLNFEVTSALAKDHWQVIDGEKRLVF